MNYLRNEELKDYTTLKIGGPAKELVSPASEEEFAAVLKKADQEGTRLFILGNGSNVLFDDEGYDGLIVHVGPQYSGITLLPDHQVRVKSGTTNEELAAFLQKEGLGGYEFACGVPGTVGGAVMMNAGCYGGETKDVLREVVWLDRQGIRHTTPAEELDLGYRHSRFMEEFGLISEAVYQFEPRSPQRIQEKMDELQTARYEKQPMDKHSCGSTFKRPEGYFAGTLIDESGLRGYRVGDAMVSEKHCGFLINDGNCTSEEFKQLIRDVQRIVKEKHGVELECEVRRVPYSQPQHESE